MGGIILHLVVECTKSIIIDIIWKKRKNILYWLCFIDKFLINSIEGVNEIAKQDGFAKKMNEQIL